MVLVYLRWWYLSCNGGGGGVFALCNKLKHKIKGFLDNIASDQNEEQEQVGLFAVSTQQFWKTYGQKYRAGRFSQKYIQMVVLGIP